MPRKPVGVKGYQQSRRGRSVTVRDYTRQQNVRDDPPPSMRRLRRGAPRGPSRQEAVENIRQHEQDQEEIELDDIMEELGEAGSEQERRVLAENVEFVMRRESMLAQGDHVIIPAGGVYDSYHSPQDPGETTGKIEAGFEVFDDTGMNIVAQGSVFGYTMEDELLDIVVEVQEAK